MVSTTPEINVRKNSEEKYVKINCLPHSKNDRSSSIGPCLASDNHPGAARKFKSMHITKLIMKQMLDQQKVLGITSKNNRNPPFDIQLLNQPGQEIRKEESANSIQKLKVPRTPTKLAIVQRPMLYILLLLHTHTQSWLLK
jgi:hypothetical protein